MRRFSFNVTLTWKVEHRYKFLENGFFTAAAAAAMMMMMRPSLNFEPYPAFCSFH
jgi:hypothetical protein